MKQILLVLSLLLSFAGASNAQSGSIKTDTFKVYGNCGMCKRTIEKAALGTKGVQTAMWDRDTDLITVSYDAALSNVDKIKKSIAKSGYDTDDFRATDKAYNKLSGCCQYERPATNSPN